MLPTTLSNFSDITTPPPAQGGVLPSGRSVTVKVAGGQEQIEIRSPDGMVEVEIHLTGAGPVVRLRGGRLELQALEEIALRCRRFEVQTAEAAELHSRGDVRISGQELHVRTQADIHMDGDVIRLNCGGAQ
jgi:uncharacterized protein (DUF2345 family)